MRVNRRRALALLGLGAAAPAVSVEAKSKLGFNHGVASGDPTQDRVILWTRITPDGHGDVMYSWRLDPVDRKGGGKRGEGVTGADRDFTVKGDVSGLDAGRPYTFQFPAGGGKSPMGRTRTRPDRPAKGAGGALRPRAP